MNNYVIFKGFTGILLEVAIAFIPIIIVFLIFQFIYLKLPSEKIIRILYGLLFSFIGLSLFLQGVQIGFYPIGQAVGERLGSMPYTWIAIPIGALLGFVVTIAEPSIRILTYQVEEVSGGYIPQKVLLFILPIGVAFSVALAITRILYQIPLLYILIPGLLSALIMFKFTSPTFIAIAFDSAGVATGPMIVTFVSAITIGMATELGKGNVLIDGFGMIALVALTPIVAVLVLGLLYGERSKNDGI